FGGRFFLKQRPEGHVPNTVTDCEVSRFLLKKGIETGEPVMSTNGAYAVIEGKHVYCAFSFKEGKEYRYSADNIRKAGEALAEFHRNTIGYSGSTSFEGDAFGWSRRMIEGLEGLDGWKERLDNAERTFKEHEPKLLKTLTHWDFHGGNIKIIEGKVVPFDFEFAHHDYRILDIANSSICFAAIRSPDYGNAESFIQKCELDFGKNRLFLDGYRNITPINDEEAGVFPEALDVAWIGWISYTLKNRKCGEKAVENAKYFPEWVERNRERIIQECR
ncbi:MAG: phosphotransferase, partial [Candidatus Aenigmatarchaeota archaeon]